MTITTIPPLGLGTWELTGDDATAAVRMALDMGYRHIDGAQVYANSDQIGQGIRDAGIDRGDFWLTDKVWNKNLTPDKVVSSTEQQLDRYGVDYLDQLLVHWPAQLDILEDTLAAMDGLRERGLVRHVGVSNFTADQVRRAAKVTDITTNQVEYHAKLDQTAVREAVADVDAVLTAYSPLARGDLLTDPVVTNIAGARHAGPAQIALRWLLDQDRVVVVPKATSEAHLRSNLDVLDMQPLQPEDTAAINALPKDQRVINPPFAPDWDQPR